MTTWTRTSCVPSGTLITCIPLAEPKKAQQSSLASQSSVSQCCSLAFSDQIVTKTVTGFARVLAEFPSPALTLHGYSCVWNQAVRVPRRLGNTLTVCLHPKKQTPSVTQALTQEIL